MILGSGTISNYGNYISNCTLNQFPYKIPVNNLQDVQLFIEIGSEPSAVQYQLIHTCGPNAGTIETLTTSSYVVGQDTNFEWYGVFKNFDNTANPLTCFVIAITLTVGGNDYIYFSEEYCKEVSCRNLTLIKGCYGNLNNKISYDCNGVYFGTHAGEGTPMGDTTIVYQHQLLLRDIEVTKLAIKNTFKQGMTRNFRTEKEKIYQFWAEVIPEWYVDEIDAIFYRGEVFVGGTKYLVNETAFEKIEDCKKIWKPTATFKESCFQSFSCEADPCAPPEQVCCDVLGVVAQVTSVEDSGESGESGSFNQITLTFTPCEPAPTNGYNIQWRIAGSIGAYEDAGTFTESPAIFNDSTNPPGAQYEGIIRSDCGEVFGSELGWATEEESGSGEDLEEAMLFWENDGNGVLVIKKNGTTIINNGANTFGNFNINATDLIQVSHNIGSAGVEGEVGSTLEVTNITDSVTLFNNLGSTSPYPDVTFSWAAVANKNYFVSAGIVGF